MKILSRKKNIESSRRQMVADRQKREQNEGTFLGIGAYRKNSVLNSRKTSSPVDTSKRAAAHQLIERRNSLMKHLIWVTTVAAILLLLLFQLSVKISIITPDTASSLMAQKYVQVLEEYYAVRPLERLRFLTNEQNLNTFLLDNAPEIKSIQLVAGGFAATNAKTTFRQPVAQWSSGSKMYFVDENGVTFETNYFDNSTVVVKDLSGVPAAEGQEVINTQFLSFLGQSVALLKESGYVVTEAILPPGTVRQVEFALEAKPYVLKMTVDRASQAQVRQAAIAIDYIDKNDSLQPKYLDVRVDQRTFYR